MDFKVFFFFFCMNSLGGESKESANYRLFVFLGSWWAIIWKCLECLVPPGLGESMRGAQKCPGGLTYGHSHGSLLCPCPSPALSVKMVSVPQQLCGLGGSGLWGGRGCYVGPGDVISITSTQVAKKRFTLENSLLILLLCCCSFEKDSSYIKKGKS